MNNTVEHGVGRAEADLGAITPEIVAVIDAAVTALIGRKLRIISVKVGSEPHGASRSWSEQGRSMIHGSHNLVQRGH